jgi:hypothetical protein
LHRHLESVVVHPEVVDPTVELVDLALELVVRVRLLSDEPSEGRREVLEGRREVLEGRQEVKDLWQTRQQVGHL